MTRNSKILSYALALASLSLVCLEAANADAGPQSAVPATSVSDPLAIPGSVPVSAATASGPKTTFILAIKTDADAPKVPMETFNLELIVNADNTVQGLHYYGPLETARRGSVPRYSLDQVVDVKDIQKGVVLMKIRDMFGKNHDVIKLDAAPEFTPASGGGLKLTYVSVGNPFGDDELGSDPLMLQKQTSTWQVAANSEKDKNQMSQMMLNRRICEFGGDHFTCGIESVAHSLPQNPAYSR